MKELLIKPSEQRVVILPDEKAEHITKGGIILPEQAQQDTPGTGKIVSTGKGSRDYPMIYHIGQKVLYSQYAGVDIKLNLFSCGEHVFKVMNQLDIMAIIEEIKS